MTFGVFNRLLWFRTTGLAAVQGVLALLWVCLHFHCQTANAAGANTVPVTGGMAPELRIELLEDPSNALALSDVRDGAFAQGFKPVRLKGEDLNLKFSGSTLWLRMPLQRGVNAPTDWLLELAFRNLDEVDFFAPGAAPVLTGTQRPFSERPVFSRFFVFPLELTPERQYFYLRLHSRYPVSAPLRLWEPRSYERHVQVTLTTQALYYGGVVALVLYNLFLYFSLGDARFVFYSLFATCMGLGILAGNGLGRMFLWPDWPAFDAIAESALLSLAVGFGMLFSIRFLQTRTQTPVLHRLLTLMAWFFFGLSALFLLSLLVPLPTPLIFKTLFISAPLAGILLMASGVSVLRKGHQDARFFLLAWSVLWLGVIGATLRVFGLLPSNTFTLYVVQISSAVEMLLLALALANLVHQERRKAEAAQQKTLQASQAMLKLVQTSEERLEHSVAQRTEQLNLALRNEQALREQHQRLGTLISHEFRNPLGIIQSQIALLKQTRPLNEALLDKRLQIMQGATQRLARMFDRWTQDDRLTGALQGLARRTLPLAAWVQELVEDNRHYQTHHRLTVQLDPRAQTIYADEELLELALFNLIDNACKYSTPGQEVRIETRIRPGATGLAVVDQGIGISTDDQQHIFQQYFRVSRENSTPGLGLGLTLVQRIVELHDGHIELHSVPGQGSSFCIWLNQAGNKDRQHE